MSGVVQARHGQGDSGSATHRSAPASLLPRPCRPLPAAVSAPPCASTLRGPRRPAGGGSAAAAGALRRRAPGRGPCTRRRARQRLQRQPWRRQAAPQACCPGKAAARWCGAPPSRCTAPYRSGCRSGLCQRCPNPAADRHGTGPLKRGGRWRCRQRCCCRTPSQSSQTRTLHRGRCRQPPMGPQRARDLRLRGSVVAAVCVCGGGGLSATAHVPRGRRRAARRVLAPRPLATHLPQPPPPPLRRATRLAAATGGRHGPSTPLPWPACCRRGPQDSADLGLPGREKLVELSELNDGSNRGLCA